MLISRSLGVEPLSFPYAAAQTTDIYLLLKILLFASLTALLGIIFCSVMHNTRNAFQKFIRNPYLRVAAGSLLVIAITFLSGTHAYNGAGMETIERALSGEADPEAFILKLLLTAVTLGSGFKGGEIVPAFFAGSTFGCTLGILLGLDPMFAAELGLIGLFCSVVNCPVTSILLSVELFGSDNFLLFGITAAVTYMLSGYYSLYSGQKFMNSKLVPVAFERPAK
jgi:H+/Cl- antiporter ClcA